MKHSIAQAAALLVFSGASAFAQPQYTIVNIGTVNMTDSAAQGFGISPGGVGFGRSVGTTATAFSWTSVGGIMGLGTFPGRTFYVGNGANDTGLVVGNASTTLSGAGSLPVLWTGGVASQLPLISPQTVGRASDVNSAGQVVGSNSSGSAEFAVIWSGGVPSAITTSTPGGAFLRVAFRINDAGQVVGQGIDPNNAARNVGILYNHPSGTAVEIPPLPGLNGALTFDVSENGYVVGSSMLNQGSGLPFIWDAVHRSTAIPLPPGTSQGSARAVNSSGWAVGTASGAFAVPFLFDGASTYRLQDLIPAGTGWDLAMNTSSSALGISESGTIVGTGLFNGQIRAYAMIPVPPSCPCDWNTDGTISSQDFFDFLTAFFDSNADFNHSGATDSQDFFDFIACLFAPPVGC
ncbi:MAG: hypothetical protein AB7G11_16035 [Phycisphaerales bacterium]